MRSSTLATRNYPKSRFKSWRGLGFTRDGTSSSHVQIPAIFSHRTTSDFEMEYAKKGGRAWPRTGQEHAQVEHQATVRFCPGRRLRRARLRLLLRGLGQLSQRKRKSIILFYVRFFDAPPGHFLDTFLGTRGAFGTGRQGSEARRCQKEDRVGALKDLAQPLLLARELRLLARQPLALRHAHGLLALNLRRGLAEGGVFGFDRMGFSTDSHPARTRSFLVVPLRA